MLGDKPRRPEVSPPRRTSAATCSLCADLVELTGQLSQLQGVQAVGITSNGLTLGRKLAALKEAGEDER